jgi:hypothetical protein
MQSFDTMGVAIDWLDAYRAASIPDILQLYDASAAVDCSCGGLKTIIGKNALAAYWQQRFLEKPASELTDLQVDGEAIVISYRVPGGVVQASLYFAPSGKIVRTVCGPDSGFPKF